MPMHEIWSFLKPSNMQYATVIQKIEEKPELANEIREDTKSSLVLDALRLVSIAKEEANAIKLLTAIAKSPAFNTFSYATPAGNTPIKAILTSCNPVVLDIFINIPDIIYSGSILTYAEATKKIGLLNSSPEKQARLKEMRSSIRDKTITKALEIWQTEQIAPAMLQRIDLAKVGNPVEQGFIKSYIKAGIYIAKLETNYEEKKARDPNSAETKAALSQLENAKLMRTLFRDKVIAEAVERNKSSILDGLEAAGDKVGNLTQDDETYYTLATKDENNPKTDILEWHENRRKALATQLSQSEAAFHNKELAKRKAEQKLAECTKAYYEKINTTLAGSGEHTTAVTRAAFGVG